jgi:hypothetical protein
VSLRQLNSEPDPGPGERWVQKHDLFVAGISPEHPGVLQYDPPRQQYEVDAEVWRRVTRRT